MLPSSLGCALGELFALLVLALQPTAERAREESSLRARIAAARLSAIVPTDICVGLLESEEGR
jgi:hypothetical protein